MSFASLAIRFASESKPKLAIPMNGVPSTFATSSRRSSPSTATRAASAGSVGTPSTRAQIVAPSARDQCQGAVGALERARERPQQAVAAECRHGLAGSGRASGLLIGMVDAARGDGAVRGAEPVERGVHRRQRFERTAAA